MKKKTLYIKGMHCPSCNVIVEDTFSELKNVRGVKADFRNQTAEINYKGTLNEDLLNNKIKKYGYEIRDKSEAQEVKEPLSQRLIQSGTIFVIFLIVFYFGQELNLLPSFNSSAGVSLTVAFLLGLVASMSTCMATSGALFLSTIGKLSSQKNSFRENILPAISFNAGRIVSYGFFGFVIGFFGKSISQTFQLGSLLTAFVAVFMILIGLDMIGLISLKSMFNFGFTKGMFQKLEGNLIKNPKKTSFLLGAITYLLPCGFTQSVQLYALGLADPVKSALLMMAFAIGTVPVLLMIGFASSFTRSSHFQLFSRAMGVIIFMIGLLYASNTLALYGVTFGGTNASSVLQNVSLVDGRQIAVMKVNGAGYSPNTFTLKKGIPVRWIVKGESVFGCQGFLQAPALGVHQTLSLGDNVIDFTPKEPGTIPFSCSMGMFRGNFTVL